MSAHPVVEGEADQRPIPLPLVGYHREKSAVAELKLSVEPVEPILVKETAAPL
jgi:hypothetical protein